MKPTAAQLKKINSFIPKDSPQLTADDVEVYTFRCADNLLNRSQSKWSIEALKTLTTMLPGRPALVDHNHYEISASFGKFFDARFEQADEVDDSVLDRAGNGELNREIFSSEGYCSIYGDAFVQKTHPINESLSYGRVGDVSMGAFRFTDYLCPECGFSLRNQKCPHVLEGMNYYGNEEQPTVPYYIRTGVTDLGECSIVNLPNLPNASII